MIINTATTHVVCEMEKKLILCFLLQLHKMENIPNKVAIVGDAGCGKNSLLIVYLTNKILVKNPPCRLGYGVMDVLVDKQKVKICLFTTSGEKSGRLAMFKGGPCMK